MMILKPKLNFNYNKLVRLNPKRVVLIVLHHRCGNGTIESIHQAHLKRGWAGCGYHYYIRKDGTVYQGRPTEYVGSHCIGNNSCSIGICFEGDFRKEKPTHEQLIACKELEHELRNKFTTIKRVLNHKDLCQTLCPVVDLKKLVAEARS